MAFDLEYLIENLDQTRMNLENEANYAVMWLSECIDFLTNDNPEMALWSYRKYLEVLNQIDMDSHKQNGQLLLAKLQELTGKS